ncbi:MAG: glycosyltransferase [Candidatus Aminicenantes bacterium]|nr:glycosyltransferase [Candidatus Aminicenantes bacterium]
MKILMVTDLYPEAEERDPSVFALHRFCRQWALDNQVWVLRPYCTPNWRLRKRPTPSWWSMQGVDVMSVAVPKFPARPWFFSGLLQRAMKRIQPDVVVGHLGFNLYLAARLAKRNRLPLVAGVHMGDLVHGPSMLGETRLKRVFGQANRLAPRSPAVSRRLLKRFPELESRSRITWSGLDSLGFLPRATGENGLFEPLAGESLQIITACRLTKLKNVDVTLRALAGLGSTISWKLTVAGDGPERSRLERLAVKLGIAARVTFTGWLERSLLRDHLSRAHLFVMVSAPETFGLVYLDAMAAGCLVVGACAEGIDGIVVDGRNGWLCPAGDAGVLGGLFLRYFSMKRDDLSRMARESRLTVADLTEEAAAKNYLEILREAKEAGAIK